MNNFTFQNPTKLIFGRGQLKELANEIPKYGKKVLLVYGGGSIKRNGLYNQVVDILDQIGTERFELSGVEPNPRISTVRKGVEICKKEGIEFLLAVAVVVSLIVRKQLLQVQNMMVIHGISLTKKLYRKPPFLSVPF